MKKFISSILVLGVLTFGFSSAFAQNEEPNAENPTEMTAEDSLAAAKADSLKAIEEAEAAAKAKADAEAKEADVKEEMPVVVEKSFHQEVKDKFIQGGWKFMGAVLICLILGLAIAIERIITLNLGTVNSDDLLNDVESALASGGVEAAKEVCKNTKGPIASIFTQGLMRVSEGIEMVEKSIVSYGSVQMGSLERGLVWISLFISLAPMLGFMGTVIGMIQAFDEIQAAGDISPQIVAGGIKVALLTTVAGLIAAVILQVFYNYCVSKIDSIVNEMEDASISIVDLLVKHNQTK